MARNRPRRSPSEDESLEDQFKADAQTLVADDAQQQVAQALDAEPEPDDAPSSILRPSELREMIEAHAAQEGKAVRDIDPHVFLREQGLPNPRRRFRVTGARATGDGNQSMEPFECDAVDESEAIHLAMNARRIRGNIRHRYRMSVVVLEE